MVHSTGRGVCNWDNTGVTGMDKVRMLERKLDVIRELKVRIAREEARLLRLLKQAKEVRAHGRNAKGY